MGLPSPCAAGSDGRGGRWPLSTARLGALLGESPGGAYEDPTIQLKSVESGRAGRLSSNKTLSLLTDDKWKHMGTVQITGSRERFAEICQVGQPISYYLRLTLKVDNLGR